ncbi:ferredoxin-type protein NapF [Vibrio tapetis subsp. quintayensis]|uniref:ferredoxin-type protein NapF n=1 Tax=Vibrio tapetis TaxID=52443 RepID=UPI0025B5D3B9|nr:ferredoxin-type protein NapF [Vibrio tapetis]MDN3678791.1 ferredoxin-type protein NapF [Vibrio tapetis subsp. quintayensis]
MVDIARRRLFSRSPKANIDTSAPLRMPWLKTESAFLDGCTRCGKCLEVCETNIIVKGEGGYPEVDFHVDECTFCGKCADVCPENLFLAQTEKPWQYRAEIDNKCLSLNGIDCRTCGEQCEVAAIKFQLNVGSVAKPMLSQDECTGCGACVAVCPTRSIKINNK